MCVCVCVCVCARTHHSICMYHDQVGEFWYQLQMTAEQPLPVALPNMECELGRWARQMIVLAVPNSEDVITVEPFVSNTNNFVLEYDDSLPLEIEAHTPLVFPLVFMPSKIGTGDQTATIVFRSQQVCLELLFSVHPFRGYILNMFFVAVL